MKKHSDEALKLDNQLCFPLYAAARRITGAYTPYLKPLGLTYTQYVVLMVLWEHDRLTVSEICSRLHLDSGTLTPLLKKMERAGYIMRERSASDERKVIISITDKGADMRSNVLDIPCKIRECVKLTDKEAAQLYTLLYKVLE